MRFLSRAPPLLRTSPPRFAEGHDTEGTLERPNPGLILSLETTLRPCLPSATGMPFIPGCTTSTAKTTLLSSNPQKPSHYVTKHTENPSAGTMTQQRLAPITSSQGEQPGLAESMSERQARLARVLR